MPGKIPGVAMKTFVAYDWSEHKKYCGWDFIVNIQGLSLKLEEN